VIHLLEAKKLGPGGNGCALFVLLQENNLDGIQLLIRHFSSGSIFHLVHHLLIPSGDRGTPALTQAQHKQLAVPFFQGFLRALQEFGTNTDGMPTQLEIDTTENIICLLLEVVSLPRAATSAETRITRRDSMGQRYNLTMLDETGGRTGRRLQDWLMVEVLSVRTSTGSVPCLNMLLQRTKGLLRRFLDTQKTMAEAAREASAAQAPEAEAEILCTPSKGDGDGSVASAGGSGSGSERESEGDGSERESESEGGSGRKRSKHWKPVDNRIGGSDGPTLTGLSLPVRLVGALARLCSNHLENELEAEASEVDEHGDGARALPPVPPPPSSPPPGPPPVVASPTMNMYPEVTAVLGFKFTRSDALPSALVAPSRKSLGTVDDGGGDGLETDGVLQRMCNAVMSSLQDEAGGLIELLPMPKNAKVAAGGVVDAGAGGYNYTAAAAAAAEAAGDDDAEAEESAGCLSGLQKIEIVRMAHASIILAFGPTNQLRSRRSPRSSGTGTTEIRGDDLGQALANAGLVPRLLRVSAAHPRSSQVHNALALVLLELIEGVGNRNVALPRTSTPASSPTLADAAAAAAAEYEAAEGRAAVEGGGAAASSAGGDEAAAAAVGGGDGDIAVADDTETPVAIALRTIPLQHSLLTGGLLKWLIEGCTRGVTKSNNYCEHRSVGSNMLHQRMMISDFPFRLSAELPSPCLLLLDLLLFVFLLLVSLLPCHPGVMR
jgi:hypothetical protein